VTRALPFQAHLPLYFWGDCILTATHLINRIPTPNLSNKSPHELLFSTPLLYSHLKVFGCLAYSSSLSRARNKFDSRDVPCVFIGCPYAIKGYRLYNLHTKFVFISRHVIFHEHIFPFAATLVHPNSNGYFLSPSSHSASPDAINFFHPLVSPIDPPVFDTPSPSYVPVSSDSISVTHDPNHVPIFSSPTNPPSSTEGLVSLNPPLLVSRKSTRTRRPPDYLQQHHCHLASTSPEPFSQASHSANSSIPFPLSSSVSYANLSSSFKHFCLSISSEVEPQYYHQVVKSAYWRDVMAQEITALEENHTWVVIELPIGKHHIGSKWVYKIKYKADGIIERYKTRLVAKGYTQSEGQDYHETFPHVAKMTIVQTLLAIAAAKRWFLHKLDVNIAFLHGNLDEEVYMEIWMNKFTWNYLLGSRLRGSLRFVN